MNTYNRVQFCDYRLLKMPDKLPRSRNSIKKAAHLSQGQVDWSLVDRKTRQAGTHHWPGSAQMAHLLALVTGEGQQK